MKITKVETRTEDNKNLEDFDELVAVYQDKKKDDKQAISINPNYPTDKILLGVSRLNQVLAKAMDMSYDDYLKLMKNAHDFTNKYENLNLSDEQLKRMIEKETRGF